MKTKLLVIAMVSLGLGLTPSLHASEEGHSDEHPKGEKHEKIPDTLGGIWYEIMEKQEHLTEIIKDKKLAKVHKAAFAIRDLAKLLPDKSKDLSTANQKKLKDSVDRIA